MTRAAKFSCDVVCATLALERPTLRHACLRIYLKLARGFGRCRCWSWGWCRRHRAIHGAIRSKLRPNVLHKSLRTRHRLVLYVCWVTTLPTPRGKKLAAPNEARWKLVTQVDAFCCVGTTMLPPTPEGCALLFVVESCAWPSATDIVC